MPKIRQGMLWYDADTRRPLSVKIQFGIKYFSEKYSCKPTWVCVHTEQYDPELKLEDLQIEPLATIQQNYFWIGPVITA